jgi:hypothetical protein
MDRAWTWDVSIHLCLSAVHVVHRSLSTDVAVAGAFCLLVPACPCLPLHVHVCFCLHVPLRDCAAAVAAKAQLRAKQSQTAALLEAARQGQVGMGFFILTFLPWYPSKGSLYVVSHTAFCQSGYRRVMSFLDSARQCWASSKGVAATGLASTQTGDTSSLLISAVPLCGVTASDMHAHMFPGAGCGAAAGAGPPACWFLNHCPCYSCSLYTTG